MSWQDIRRSYSALRETAQKGGDIPSAWAVFVNAARHSESETPYHLRTLLSLLKKVQGDRVAADVRILDHGCGSGMTMFYLAALGYHGVYGVDVGVEADLNNGIMAHVLGATDQRFFVYDGYRLPLADGSIEFVFSQQVLEHVKDDVFDAYYAEEARVLKAGGCAFHQVPHRFSPYESHSGTWFIHYFPPSIRNVLYRLCGKDPAYLDSMLHLRAPYVHRRQLISHIGTCEDVTLSRLTDVTDFPYYDGPVSLRRLVSAAVTAPLIGGLAGALFRQLVMLDTVSVKPE